MERMADAWVKGLLGVHLEGTQNPTTLYDPYAILLLYTRYILPESLERTFVTADSARHESKLLADGQQSHSLAEVL